MTAGDFFLYVFANLIPLVNFLALLFVIVSMQIIRADLKARTKRFERIEQNLAHIEKIIDDTDPTHGRT